MGLGCNAAGVMGCRIIGSERERLLAILTNSFMPCNGRFPLLIALGGYLFAGKGSSLEAAVCLTFALLFSVWATMAANMLLSRTILRGKASEFIMELPPYRRANAGKVLTRSVADRVGYVLARAVSMAAPAGALIWSLSRITADGVPVLKWMADWIDPAAGWFGLSGGVLLAFILAWPANELVFPLLVMIGQMGGGFLQSGGEMGTVFSELGWSRRSALCAMILCLFHWPCSTTVLTIRKETGSWKWTLLAVALPTGIGLLLCRLIAVL